MTKADLKKYFPWLDTNEEVNAADVVDHLNDLYHTQMPDSAVGSFHVTDDGVPRLTCPHCKTPGTEFRIVEDGELYWRADLRTLTEEERKDSYHHNGKPIFPPPITHILDAESRSYDVYDEGLTGTRVECRTCYEQFQVPDNIEFYWG